jgi:glycosyltransferase involved in cell wall biosynthesis
MRILLLAHAPSVHTRRWALGLAARGHEVRLLSAHGVVGALPDASRIVGWPLPVAALRYASARGAVRAELRAYRPDVTVAHFLPNYGFLAAISGARPWMLVCWGSDLLRNATRTPFHRARARWTLQNAQAVHVDARNLEAAAVRLGADPARVWTRPWGVDVDSLAPAGSWADRRGSNGVLRVLWTRQLEPVYDPSGLIRALGLLARMGVPFRATIAGSGPMLGALESLASREGLRDSVSFTGWIDGSVLTSLYRSHHAYVSLSRSDSTSQSLLEAMAAGLVPVVTDIEGNREWVTHRREGLLVPVGDAEAVACALAEVSRGTEAAAAMAARARTTAASRGRFSDTLAEIERRLLDLAGSRARSGPLETGGR